MPPEHDVTHRDLWVKLAELGGKLDVMATMMADRKEAIERITKDLDHLFGRQRITENKLAMVMMVGLILSIVVPTAATVWAARIAAPQVEIRESIR